MLLKYDRTSCVLCIQAFDNYKNDFFFAKNTFSKFMTFKAKNTFEPKMFKCVAKIKFANFNSFALLIINIMILSNFEKKLCAHLIRKNDV